MEAKKGNRMVILHILGVDLGIFHDMIHIMNTKRPYRSTQRREQVDKTRERILEALIKTMARGITSVSIPAVASEAGVSVPTVYRYFRTKTGLVEALGPYVTGKMGISARELPRSPEELAAMVREMYVRAEGMDDTLKAALVSEVSAQLRKDALPIRLKLMEGALAPVWDRLNEKDRVRLRNAVLILSSSAVMRAFKQYLDLSGEEAADCVTWAICALARAAMAKGDEGLQT